MIIEQKLGNCQKTVVNEALLEFLEVSSRFLVAYANDPPSKLTARTSAFEHEREKKFNQIEKNEMNCSINFLCLRHYQHW